MLRSITIRDFVIVDALDLDFEPGFTVFSGETGAGKSILVDALAFCLGERSDASIIRAGATRAEVNATFTDLPRVAADWMNAAEMDANEGVIVRRTVDSAGRSKAWINGSASTIAQLREFGELMVDIHGQHAHQSLVRTEAQRQMLDTQGGSDALAQAVARAFRRWQDAAHALSEARASQARLHAERESIMRVIDELDRLAPREGEWQEIDAEHQRLSHAATLIEGAQQALLGLAESEDAISDRLFAIAHRIGQLEAIDARLKAVTDALEPARIQIQEAVYALNDYLGRTDLDPERLAEVEARVNALHSAARRHRVRPDELAATLESHRSQLAALDASADIGQLEQNEAREKAAYLVEAKALSQARTGTAKALSDAVTEAMQALSMPGGRFHVALHPSEPGATGLESIEFEVAANPGTPLRPLARVASGGELARISLAISVIASTATTIPTLIFDEVDAGIGGGVAEVVGRLLQQLGQMRQVLCVTHLPQVAAQADHHMVVAKASNGATTTSSVRPIAGTERIEEVARMLGGVEITATTRKHARELLARAAG